MALAEKALKVGGKTFEVADFKTCSAAHFCFFSLQHDLPSNQETVDSCPYFYIPYELFIMSSRLQYDQYVLIFESSQCMYYSGAFVL